MVLGLFAMFGTCIAQPYMRAETARTCISRLRHLTGGAEGDCQDFGTTDAPAGIRTEHLPNVT